MVRPGSVAGIGSLIIIFMLPVNLASVEEEGGMKGTAEEMGLFVCM